MYIFGYICLSSVKEVRHFGVLVRNQTAVLVEVMTSNPCVKEAKNFEEDRRLRNMCTESWRISWYEQENYGLDFKSCLQEGNDGWMRLMLILRRYMFKKRKMGKR